MQSAANKLITTAGFIDGRFVEGLGDRLVVDNPSDGSVIADLKGLSAEQSLQALACARKAFDDGVWSARSMNERAELMHRFVDALETECEAGDRGLNSLPNLLGAETGCPQHVRAFAAQLQTPLKMAREIIDFMASLPELVENPLPASEALNPLGKKITSLRRYSPLGVVVGISAYNFPLHTGVWKTIPALMAGNSVILRPNPLTPLSSLAFGRAAKAAGLPSGVLNVVLEAGVEGAGLLTSSPGVEAVSFTGSSVVGAQVASQAAPTFKRLQLELGGKSAQIFMPDSAEGAVNAVVSVCTAHAGQGCVLGTRIFVPEERKQELLQKAAAALLALRVGHAGDPETQVGPVISAAQVARCERFVRLAVEHGGRIAVGGKKPDHLQHGYFFEPTLLDLPDNRNPAAQEEIFGPVAAIIGYRDIDHAVEMANDSRFGLSGYVFGKDGGEAFRVAQRIHSGAVHVNGALSSTYAPFGGIKESGMGHERGEEGMRFFQRLTVYSVTES